MDVLNHWIETHNKKLTGEQKSYILHMFEKCPLPLYFKLSFREALEWTSFRPIEECRLQDTIRGTIDHMFAKLESKHGKLFISRVLGYITIGTNLPTYIVVHLYAPNTAVPDSLIFLRVMFLELCLFLSFLAEQQQNILEIVISKDTLNIF